MFFFFCYALLCVHSSFAIRVKVFRVKFGLETRQREREPACLGMYRIKAGILTNLTRCGQAGVRQCLDSKERVRVSLWSGLG